MDGHEIYLMKNLNALIEPGRLSFVCRQVGINKSTLHGYMNGVFPRSLLSLVELSKFLKVEPKDLLFANLSVKKPEQNKDFNFPMRFEVTIQTIKTKGSSDDLPF